MRSFALDVMLAIDDNLLEIKSKCKISCYLKHVKILQYSNEVFFTNLFSFGKNDDFAFSGMFCKDIVRQIHSLR